MPLVYTECNRCASQHCGSCDAEKLESTGFIKSAGDHCVCASNGHDREQSKRELPKIKGNMFGKKKDDETFVEREVTEE